MTSRDQFEQAYAEFANCTVKWCQEQRLTNGSYLDRYLARAWYFWELSREAA